MAVTGAGGFIGTALLRCLVRRGLQVRGLCHRHRQPPAAVPGIERWLYGDVLEGEALPTLLAGADVVVHLAGQPSVAESFRLPRDFARTHVEGTVAVLDACRGAGVRRFVYLSSAEVYGPARADFVDESQPCEPRSPYGACKLAAEHMVRVYALAGVVEATILRAFSVYGPGQPEACVLAEILRQSTRGDRVQLADLRPVRDFTHVDDIAAAIASAARFGSDEAVRILNVGSGVGVSIGELARRVFGVLGRRGEVASAPHGDRPASASVARLVADPRRAAAALDWRASVSLSVGLRDLLRAPVAAGST